MTPILSFLLMGIIPPVCKYGKNLIEIKSPTKLVNCELFAENNTLGIRKTNTIAAYSNAYFSVGALSQFIGKMLTVSLKNTGSYAWMVYIGGLTAENEWIAPGSAIGNRINGNSNTEFTFVVPDILEANTLCVRFQSVDNSIATDEIYTLKDIQLNMGDTVTEYEPYKEPEAYMPDSDGIVEDVTSLYPTTTLLKDTEGVIIKCEYNRDINKAFEELTNAIISLGGNV